MKIHFSSLMKSKEEQLKGYICLTEYSVAR